MDGTGKNVKMKRKPRDPEMAVNQKGGANDANRSSI